MLLEMGRHDWPADVLEVEAVLILVDCYFFRLFDLSKMQQKYWRIRLIFGDHW
jgi:hypothetical protein